VKLAKRPLVQSKLPPSTIMPPIEVPWPPMNLVVLWVTMLAPHSKGRHKVRRGKGVVDHQRHVVLWAMAATSSKGKTADVGVAQALAVDDLGVGPDGRFERLRVAGSTKLTSMPSFAGRCS
jgi:hypothetical protein